MHTGNSRQDKAVSGKLNVTTQVSAELEKTEDKHLWRLEMEGREESMDTVSRRASILGLGCNH